MNLSYIARNISMAAWNALDNDAGFGLAGACCVDGEMHDMWSLGVRTIDAAAHINYFNKLAQFYKDYPDAEGSTWQPCGIFKQSLLLPINPLPISIERSVYMSKFPPQFIQMRPRLVNSC